MREVTDVQPIGRLSSPLDIRARAAVENRRNRAATGNAPARYARCSCPGGGPNHVDARASLPSQRALRVYAFDPSRGARLDNVLTIQVPYEPLKRGPVGRKVAVIDYDASNRCYYEGVDLDAGHDPRSAAAWRRPRRTRSSTSRWSYAVVMDTVRRFEVALGATSAGGADRRRTPTSRTTGCCGSIPTPSKRRTRSTIRQLRALLFGYFAASEDDAGTNLPGPERSSPASRTTSSSTRRRTPSSTGSVAHFTEPTGPDAAAFHEGFADIVALLPALQLQGDAARHDPADGRVHPPASSSADVDAGRRRRDDPGRARRGQSDGRSRAPVRRGHGEPAGAAERARHRRRTRDVLQTHRRAARRAARSWSPPSSTPSSRVYISAPATSSAWRIRTAARSCPNFLHADLADRLAREAAEDRHAHPEHLPPRARLLPAGRHHVRRLSPRAGHADREAVAGRRRGYRAALINALPRPRHPSRGRDLVQRGRPELGARTRAGRPPTSMPTSRDSGRISRTTRRSPTADEPRAALQAALVRSRGLLRRSSVSIATLQFNVKSIRHAAAACGPTARCTGRSWPSWCRIGTRRSPPDDGSPGGRHVHVSRRHDAGRQPQR